MEDIEDESVTAKKKPKIKKWKHLARDISAMDESKMGQFVKKRPIEEIGKWCPEAKKLKKSSLMKLVIAHNGMFFSATLNANSEASDMEEMEVIGSTTEELTMEASGQTHRQL